MRLTISVIKSPIDSFIGYGQEIINYAEESGIDKVKTAKPYVLLNRYFEEMKEGFKKSRKGSFTEKLYDADDDRDKPVRGIRMKVNGFLYSDVEEEKEAATLIGNILEKYGPKMLNTSYVKQNAAMNKLIADLRTPEATAALATLGLTNDFSKVVTAQQRFEEIYSRSIDEKAVFNSSASASSLRKNVNDSLQLFLKYLEIELLTDEDPKLLELCQKIQAFNIKFEQNEMRKKKDATDDEKPLEEIPEEE